jgi:hypothetical protein
MESSCFVLHPSIQKLVTIPEQKSATKLMSPLQDRREVVYSDSSHRIPTMLIMS